MTLKARCRSKPNCFSLVDFIESLLGNATQYVQFLPGASMRFFKKPQASTKHFTRIFVLTTYDKQLDELRVVISQFDDFIRHLHSPRCGNTEPLLIQTQPATVFIIRFAQS